jgi:hypothetical protein
LIVGLASRPSVHSILLASGISRPRRSPVRMATPASRLFLWKRIGPDGPKALGPSHPGHLEHG